MNFDHIAWGLIASRQTWFERQCFYFSELDIHVALLARGERRLVEALAKIGSGHTPPPFWQQRVWNRLK